LGGLFQRTLTAHHHHATTTTTTHRISPTNLYLHRASTTITVTVNMDVLKAVQTYVVKMITEVPGMKVLLLDAHTASSTSWVLS
jgi:hypothetical protein